MNPIRLLAKMTPKTLNIGEVGGSSAADKINEFTAAHSLAGLSDDASRWAYYNYVGIEKEERKIIRTLTMTVTLFVKIEKYRIKPDTLDGIVRAAMLEFTQPICGVCSGSGWINDKLRPKQCENCGGHGRKLMSQRQRCRIIGIDTKSYLNSHDDVAKKTMQLIAEWEQQIFKNIREKIGEVA